MFSCIVRKVKSDSYDSPTDHLLRKKREGYRGYCRPFDSWDSPATPVCRVHFPTRPSDLYILVMAANAFCMKVLKSAMGLNMCCVQI